MDVVGSCAERFCCAPVGARLIMILDAGPVMSAAGGDDMSKLVVVDAAGHAVSCVQSLFEIFRLGVVCPSHGLVSHNRAMLERLDDDPVCGLRGGFRPFYTLCPRW